MTVSSAFLRLGDVLINLEAVRKVSLNQNRANTAKPFHKLPDGSLQFPVESAVVIAYREFVGATDEWHAEDSFFGE